MDNWITYLLVAGALVTKNDRILFVRQTYEPYVGMWGFPTGLVDPGERVGEAALRETQEEAGILARSEGALSVYSIAREEPMLYIVLLARHIEGDPTPDGTENDRAAYLSRDEVTALHQQGKIITPCFEMADLYWQGKASPLPLRDAITADETGRAVSLYL